MTNPLIDETWFKFDKELFIKKIKEFRDYFIKEVKIINNVIKEVRNNITTYEIDIPSMDLLVRLYRYSDGYYMDIEYEMDKLVISTIPLTKKEYYALMNSFDDIYYYYINNYVDYYENKEDVLRKIFEMWANGDIDE